MKLGFVVNEIATEKPNYASTHLAMTAVKMGHEVFYMGVGDLVYHPDGHMGAHARRSQQKKFKSGASFLDAIQKEKDIKITATDLDVIFLRNDPSADMISRPWAQNAGIIFGQLAMKQGVIVLNDPTSLSDAMNKMYFQHFPEEVRPKTIITRNPEDIKQFFEEQGQKMVLKPLQGSGGTNVFLVKKDQATNLNQMIEAVSRDGYVIAQEYLPEASEGDIRLFVMNGMPLEYKGKYAAIHRKNTKDDIRSNMHVGGKAKKAKIDDKILHMVEVVRPKLVQDGMFLVGLDIVGSKLMEINVFSPGGIYSAQEIEGANFCEKIIKTIECKVHYKKTYDDGISNLLISTL